MWLSFISRLTFVFDLWLTSALVLLTSRMADTQEHFQQYPILKVSQCFKSRSIPKVMFGCPSSGSMIRIVRAFHGRRGSRSMGSCSEIIRSPHEDPACLYCEGDCIDDTINEVYDWSSCIGRSSCVRTVLQSYIHSCPEPEKFSEYLHLEYQCIPRHTTVNICADSKQVTSFGGDVTSPNYPISYPTNQDCSCTLRADDPNIPIVLSFYDLFLETKNDRCRADWLMLLQDGEKHRHCGVITSGSKNITTVNGHVTLQFHSNSDDRDALPTASVMSPDADKSAGNAYKGFWVHFEAQDKRSAINIVCGPLQPNDPALLEARSETFEDDVTIGRQGDDERDDGGQAGRTNTERSSGDSVKTTDLGARQLDDGVTLRKQPPYTNDGSDEKHVLSPTSSSQVSAAATPLLLTITMVLCSLLFRIGLQ